MKTKFYDSVKWMLVFAFLASFSVFDVAGQITWSVRTGLNVSDIAGIDDENLNFKSKAGFHVGGLVDVSLSKRFSVQSGLFYTMRGGGLKDWEYDDEDEIEIERKEKITTHYFQVPVWGSYKYDFGPVAISAFTGPYIALGIGGRYISNYEAEDISENEQFYLKSKSKVFGSKARDARPNMKESNDNTLYYDNGNLGWRRFDIGWSLGAGVHYKVYYLGLQYDWGFINMDRQDLKHFRPVNRNFSLSLGYTF